MRPDLAADGWMNVGPLRGAGNPAGAGLRSGNVAEGARDELGCTCARPRLLSADHGKTLSPSVVALRKE